MQQFGHLDGTDNHDIAAELCFRQLIFSFDGADWTTSLRTALKGFTSSKNMVETSTASPESIQTEQVRDSVAKSLDSAGRAIVQRSFLL